jgi:hypothetical protein
MQHAATTKEHSSSVSGLSDVRYLPVTCSSCARITPVSWISIFELEDYRGDIRRHMFN